MAYTRKLPYSSGCNRCDCTRTCIVCLYVGFFFCAVLLWSRCERRQSFTEWKRSVTALWLLCSLSVSQLQVCVCLMGRAEQQYAHTQTHTPLQKSSCSRHSTQDKIGDLFVPQSNRTRQRGAFPAELCGDVGVFFFILFVLYNRHFWMKLL